MSGCALHGEAITYGCPGCRDFVDDLVIAKQVRERLANDTGERITLEELAIWSGVDLGRICEDGYACLYPDCSCPRRDLP